MFNCTQWVTKTSQAQGRETGGVDLASLALPGSDAQVLYICDIYNT